MNNNIINNRAVENAVRAFKDSLITLIDSRNYAITQELYTEMKAILNACDSVKLDNMFLAKSETWRSQFNAADLAQKQQGNLTRYFSILLYQKFINYKNLVCRNI